MRLERSWRLVGVSVCVLVAATLVACDDDGGGGDGGSSGRDGGQTDVDGGPLVGGGTVTTEEGEIIDLGFGRLVTTNLTLPDGHINAPEVYQLAHYIGRTDPEVDEDDIDIPIRSYVASCGAETGSPRLFASVTLAEGDGQDQRTFGSVYELELDPDTGRFTPTGNAAILPRCIESHGVAVSPDCSRVGVLCNVPYQESERAEVSGDLIEQYGTEWMQWEDNHDEIDDRLVNDIGLMITTNHRAYIGFFTEHESITFGDFLSSIQSMFPDRGFDETSTWDDLSGRDNAEVMAHIVEQLSDADREGLYDYIRGRAYRENEQIWLLEWDGASLSEEPSAYVVNKMHGGTHTGAEELLYVHDDSQGRTSYAFSVTARVFDPRGGSHYSAGLTVVQRDTWSIHSSTTSDDHRGWYWACGDGHLLNIRSYYDPSTERYGAICTSDGNDWGFGRGALGTIAIKQEDRSTTYEGWSSHFVPATSALVSNGGGHTVVPTGAGELLSLIVAPRFIEDADMDRFLRDEVGVDTSTGGPYDDDCEAWDDSNCFYAYLSSDSGDYPSSHGAFYDGGELTPVTLTRIGLTAHSSENARPEGGYRWIASDDDCQLSDPQLIDLQNGRYLFGYARFQCISDAESVNRLWSSRGADRMLVPQAYYLAEIDASGELLAGPFELDGHGWGGIDEPVLIEPGRVAWTYIRRPTIGDYGGGEQSSWEALVYESNTAP